MRIYFFKNKIINLIASIILLIITGIFGVLYLKGNSAYMQFITFFLALSILYFIFFIISWNKEKKEQRINKEFEKENGITDDTLQQNFKANVIEYVYTNQWNLPGFVIDIKSGYISIGDKIMLPNNKKTKITNIFFQTNRKPTRRAYAGETVKIILYGVRNNKDLDKGMEISKYINK